MARQQVKIMNIDHHKNLLMNIIIARCRENKNNGGDGFSDIKNLDLESGLNNKIIKNHLNKLEKEGLITVKGDIKNKLYKANKN